MAFQMTDSLSISSKVGAGISSDFDNAHRESAELRVTGFINCFCRVNYSDTYAGLNADVKGILSDIASSLVAIEGIAYDTSGYDSIIEAEDKINVLRDSALRELAILEEKDTQKFINDA